MRDMLGKQAKILAPRDVADLLALAECSRHPHRNRVIVLLSAKAGLRAGEIASLTWDMVVDAGGQIGNVIELRDHAAKKGPCGIGSRRIASSRRAWGTMGFATTLRQRPPSGHCRAG